MHIFLPYDFLNNIFFPLDYLIVRIQYTIYLTYKIWVRHLVLLFVRCLINIRLLLAKPGEVKSYTQILNCVGLHGELVPLIPVLFKGQLYIQSYINCSLPACFYLISLSTPTQSLIFFSYQTDFLFIHIYSASSPLGLFFACFIFLQCLHTRKSHGWPLPCYSYLNSKTDSSKASPLTVLPDLALPYSPVILF